MAHVISASKRTDIPAFHLPWFRERVRDGFVDVPNPYRRSQVRRVSLAPTDVAWIVFWSRNYGVFTRLRDAFADHRLFFQFTINPPNAFLEPDVIDTEEAMRQVDQLASWYGAERITWRYDPIVSWRRAGQVETNFDPDWFDRTCARMRQIGIARSVTSFADSYQKVQWRIARSLPGAALVDLSVEQQRRLAAELLEIADHHGMQLASCAEPGIEGVEAGDATIERAACVDGALLNRLAAGSCDKSAARVASTGPASDRRVPGRAACGCTAMVDVGDYQLHECGYACLYCYANPNHRRYTGAPARLPGDARTGR